MSQTPHIASYSPHYTFFGTILPKLLLTLISDSHHSHFTGQSTSQNRTSDSDLVIFITAIFLEHAYLPTLEIPFLGHVTKYFFF